MADSNQPPIPAAIPDDSEQTTPDRLPTALVTDPAMLAHRVPQGFPEVPARLEFATAMIEALLTNGTLSASNAFYTWPRARRTEDELAAVHDQATSLAFATPSSGCRRTRSGRRTRLLRHRCLHVAWHLRGRAARRGCPLVALDAIGEGRARNGYALVRPPGHHARPAEAMGFLLLQQYRGGGALCPTALGMVKGTHRRLRRASWQRHAGYLL